MLRPYIYGLRESCLFSLFVIVYCPPQCDDNIWLWGVWQQWAMHVYASLEGEMSGVKKGGFQPNPTHDWQPLNHWLASGSWQSLPDERRNHSLSLYLCLHHGAAGETRQTSEEKLHGRNKKEGQWDMLRELKVQQEPKKTKDNVRKEEDWLWNMQSSVRVTSSATPTSVKMLLTAINHRSINYYF